VMDAGLARDAGEHLGGIDQLWYPFRTDEAGRLDALQTGGREPVDQRDLVGGGDQSLLVLQPVARADFDDADVVVHADSEACANATSTASASTKSPAAARTSAMVPARGALRLSSIFIASITITSWPASTTSPAAALTTTTRPGIGATTLSAPAPVATSSGPYDASGWRRRRRSPSWTSRLKSRSSTVKPRARAPIRRLRWPSCRRAPLIWYVPPSWLVSPSST